MKTGCIYRIIAPNGKSYIGQAVDYVRRMRRHKKMNDGCPLIKKAIKKYGWENMKKTILARNMTKEQMDREESNLIKIYDTFGENGYNLTKGGEGGLGRVKTKRERAKISAGMMGNKNGLGAKHPPITAEARAKNSAVVTKLWEDPEYREKCTAKKIGNTNAKGKRTPEQRGNMSAGCLALGDNHHSKRPEARERVSVQMKGDKNPMKLWENKVNLSLSKQRAFYEKQLEATG